jgi:hypothetical protein
LTRGQSIGSENVPLLAIDEVEQGDAGIANRIVLDRCHLGGHAVFFPLEINDAVLLLVAAAAMPGGDPPLVVAAAFFAQGTQQRLFRLGAFGKLGEIADARAAAASGNRVVLPDAHDLNPD